MQEKILIYGHGDKSEKGFSNETEFRNYIGGKIFTETYNGRYRYSQKKDADIIILTRDGFAHGYFVIAALDDPTEKDKKNIHELDRFIWLRSQHFLKRQSMSAPSELRDISSENIFRKNNSKK